MADGTSINYDVAIRWADSIENYYDELFRMYGKVRWRGVFSST